MKNNLFPTWNDPRIIETIQYLQSLINTGRNFHVFLRNYFGNNLIRMAQNIVYLREVLPVDGSYLDVGSFGLEPAVIQKENNRVYIEALNRKGSRVGIDSAGFCNDTENDGSEIHFIDVRSVNVEKEKFPFADDRFDIVTCFETLEHLKYNPVPMLKEIKRVIKPDGLLVISTPNINSALSCIRILSGESPQMCPYYHIPVENPVSSGIIHPKEYTFKEMHILLSSLGFEILVLDGLYTCEPRFKEKIFSFLMKMYIGIKSLFFDNTFHFHGGDKIIVIARKGGVITDEIPQGIFS